MEGITYLTNDKNERIAVQIDLKKYGELWEDICDTIVAESRKDDESISLDELKKDLKKWMISNISRLLRRQPNWPIATKANIMLN